MDRSCWFLLCSQYQTDCAQLCCQQSSSPYASKLWNSWLCCGCLVFIRIQKTVRKVHGRSIHWRLLSMLSSGSPKPEIAGGWEHVLRNCCALFVLFSIALGLCCWLLLETKQAMIWWCKCSIPARCHRWCLTSDTLRVMQSSIGICRYAAFLPWWYRESSRDMDWDDVICLCKAKWYICQVIPPSGKLLTLLFLAYQLLLQWWWWWQQLDRKASNNSFLPIITKHKAKSRLKPVLVWLCSLYKCVRWFSYGFQFRTFHIELSRTNLSDLLMWTCVYTFVSYQWFAAQR